MITARPDLRRLVPLLFLAGLIGLAAICLRAAWMSDDAYITLRVVDNFLHGLGLRWNVADRVQIYTHPLWLALLIAPYAITGETLWTVCTLSILLTVTAAAILARPLLRSARPWRALFLVAMLAASKSVLCFATSGLENPLALLLLAILVERSEVSATPRDAAWRCAIVALIALTRLDLLLVALPVLVAQLRASPLRVIVRASLLGALPLIAWELFSLVYYGSLLPNTAYAKLGTGIPRLDLLRQGLRYYQSLGRWDPFGAGVLATGMAVGLVARRRPLAVGLGLYGLYLLWIGGDFMCGRFFMIPIALSAYLLCDSPWPGRARWWLCLLPILALLADDYSFKRWMRADGPAWLRWGIMDERLYYYAHTGLLSRDRARDLDNMYYSRFGRRLIGKGVVEETCVGMVGFYAGPSVHLVDALALGDPLLARLPVENLTRIRIGHFERPIPPGYTQSLRSGENLIGDPYLAMYWQRIATVTRGPIWSWARLRAMVELFDGHADRFRDAYVARRRATAGH